MKRFESVGDVLFTPDDSGHWVRYSEAMNIIDELKDRINDLTVKPTPEQLADMLDRHIQSGGPSNSEINSGEWKTRYAEIIALLRAADDATSEPIVEVVDYKDLHQILVNGKIVIQSEDKGERNYIARLLTDALKTKINSSYRFEVEIDGMIPRPVVRVEFDSVDNQYKVKMNGILIQEAKVAEYNYAYNMAAKMNEAINTRVDKNTTK